MRHIHAIPSLLLAGITVGTAAAQKAKAPKSAPQQRPNVLFIAVDDLNTWLHCTDMPRSITPNMDRLAARSVVFTQAYCPAPYSGPSRTAVLTGYQPFTSGYYNHVGMTNFRSMETLRDAVTLPRYFHDNGYVSMGSGKIFHNITDSISWDVYYPSKEKAKPAETYKMQNSVDFDADGNIKGGAARWADGKRGKMSDEEVAEWVAAQLGKTYDRPFFLGGGIFKPHLPWIVPQEFYDYHPLSEIVLPLVKADDLDDIPTVGRKICRSSLHNLIVQKGLWPTTVQSYMSCITFADKCIGTMLDALDRSPYRDNTIVVLWSDNGWSLGSKHHWQKMALWEEETHINFMVCLPGVTDGARCASAVNLIDIYPTLVELCGLPQKAGLEGKSIAALIKNPKMEWDKPVISTWGEGNYAIRSNRYRYIRYWDGGEELYDHKTDSLEWTNLAGKQEYKKIIADLATYLPDPSKVRSQPGAKHSDFYAGAGEDGPRIKTGSGTNQNNKKPNNPNNKVKK